MENELSKESDSVGLFAYCKIKYLKLHLKWTIIPAEDVVLRRRHALITVGSGYGSDGNADRCIAVIARDTDSNFYGVLRQKYGLEMNVSGLFYCNVYSDLPSRCDRWQRGEVDQA